VKIIKEHNGITADQKLNVSFRVGVDYKPTDRIVKDLNKRLIT
jgi:hypothetical protein